MIYDDETLDQNTTTSEVDELRDLIEKLRIRQENTELHLLETKVELKRVSEELSTLKRGSIKNISKTEGKELYKGDRVLVTTPTKNRKGDKGVIHRHPNSRSIYCWVLPDGKKPEEAYRVTRKYLIKIQEE